MISIEWNVLDAYENILRLTAIHLFLNKMADISPLCLCPMCLFAIVLIDPYAGSQTYKYFHCGLKISTRTSVMFALVHSL